VRALVTGANGFVGRFVCERLQQAGHRVRAAVRAADRGGFPHDELYVSGDLDGQTSWDAALEGVDLVFHIAGLAHLVAPSAEQRTRFAAVNRDGTESLARAVARSRQVTRLVLLSSAKVSGETSGDRPFSVADHPSPTHDPPVSAAGRPSPVGDLPFSADDLPFSADDRPFSADHRPFSADHRPFSADHRPFSADDRPLSTAGVQPPDEYARSKWESELALRRELPPGRFTIVRTPLVYGPGVRANFLSLMTKAGWPLPFGAVRNARSLIFVRNLADALVWLSTNASAAGQTCFVSDDDDVSTPELIRRMARAMNKSAILPPVPVPLLRLAARAAGKSAALEKAIGSLRVDIDPIRALGWRPPFTMEQGLAETARWLQKRGETGVMNQHETKERP